MSVNRALQPDKIHIVNTQIVKCNIDCPFDFAIGNVKGHDSTLEFDMAFNLEDSLVKADFILSLITKSKTKVEEESKGQFHFVFIFNVENLKELVTEDDNGGLILHGGLGNAIASITYSTSRGMLFARLTGTSLESFSLPIIDPNSLLKSK